LLWRRPVAAGRSNTACPLRPAQLNHHLRPFVVQFNHISHFDSGDVDAVHRERELAKQADACHYRSGKLSWSVFIEA
jgi:hypothetical protein